MNATKAFDRRWATSVLDETAGEPSSAARADDRESFVDLIGRTLGGKFRVEALVGTGAMGNVYRATHVVLDKSVAVKVIRAAYSSRELFRQRFLQEALTASRLEHPNTVQVLDYGTEPDGVTYIVMELLRGRTLADVMDEERKLPAERIVAIMSQVLSAIAAAHDAGIVHRDLKPENVMLVPRVVDDSNEISEVVKVMDFGIAAVVGGSGWSKTSERSASDEAIMGTPGYMSPEQLRGMKLDARSDVYACGVILFELLTGRPPFVAENVTELMRMTLAHDPPHPRDVDPTCDGAIADVVSRALRPDREQRFEHARALRNALRAAVAHRAMRDDADASTTGARRAVAGQRQSMETLADPAQIEAAVGDIGGPSVVATAAPPQRNGGSLAPTRRVRWRLAALAIAVPVVAGALGFVMRHPRVQPATEINDARSGSAALEPRHDVAFAPPIVASVAASPTTVAIDRSPFAEPDSGERRLSSARANSRSSHVRVESTRSRGHARIDVADARAHALADARPTSEPMRSSIETPLASTTGHDGSPALPLAATTAHVATPPAHSEAAVATIHVASAGASAPAIVTPPRVPRAAHATVESVQATAGAPRAPLTSRGQRAAEALGRCATREVSVRGAAAGLDATRHVRLVVDVRDERLDDLHVQGGPAWTAMCASALRDSFAGALPAAEDVQYTVTVDIALSPQL
jgi:serine/threonine-protein kinase